jgi:hypothetical protein
MARACIQPLWPPVPVPANTPFGSPEMFLMSAIDVTAGTPAAVIPSHGFTCGESGWLPGRAHIYRAPVISHRRVSTRRRVTMCRRVSTPA